MRQHDILDWRLGLELASILAGKHVTYSTDKSYVRKAARTFIEFRRGKGWEERETPDGLEVRNASKTVRFTSCFELPKPSDEFERRNVYEVFRLQG